MAGLSSPERAVLALTALATALAGVADYASWPAVLAFGLATVALAGLAWIVSVSTEQVGERLGPAATGLMQASVGNLPEVFVVIFALDAGEVVVAQTSILGSLFANALLILGVVIVVGSRREPDRVMRFHSRLPNDTATLLLATVFIIVLVGLLLSSHDPASRHVNAISAVAAVCLLAVYLAWLIPYLREGARAQMAGARPAGGDAADPESPGPGTARLTLGASLILLAVAGVGAAFVSDWFIHALRPALRRLDLSPAFAGLVIVAIAGNAVEHVVGIVLAARGKYDLAISVVKNSVAQIAAFVFPLVVLASLPFATSLTFALAPVYIGALLIMAIAVWQITGDGEATPFEGWALIALYVILAVVAVYE
jgi:Ca2+:H+ antiporter